MRTATIYNFLLEASLMASIAILLMLIVRAFFRKWLGNRAIYFAWLLVAIRLLCPLALPNPLINTIRPTFSTDQGVRPIAAQLQVRFADLSQQAQRWAARQSANEDSDPLVQTLDAFVNDNYNGMLSLRLMQGYLLGAALVLGWFLLANLRFRRRLRADRIEPISGKLLEQYLALCKARGVKPVPVYFTDPLPSACLVGAVRPYIALPLTAAPQSAIQVLAHEVSHLKGHDHLWAILRLLCCVVHWFNPLVWLAASMSRTDCELACDDRAVDGLPGGDKLAYANVLVLAAAKRCAPGVAVLATGMTMTGRKLKTRVNAILHRDQVKRGLALAFALLCCMALVGAFATAERKSWTPMPVFAEEEIIAPRTLQSEEDALQYAQELWASPYLGQDVSRAKWEARFYDVADDGQRYDTAANADGYPSPLSATFLTDGSLLYLNNGCCGYNDAVATVECYGNANPDKRDEVCDYLRRFCRAVLPGAAVDVESFRHTGEGDYSNGDEHFVSFVAGATDPDSLNEYSFGVQVYPEVRVVGYHLYRGMP